MVFPCRRSRFYLKPNPSLEIDWSKCPIRWLPHNAPLWQDYVLSRSPGLSVPRCDTPTPRSEPRVFKRVEKMSNVVSSWAMALPFFSLNPSNGPSGSQFAGSRLWSAVMMGYWPICRFGDEGRGKLKSSYFSAVRGHTVRLCSSVVEYVHKFQWRKMCFFGGGGFFFETLVLSV